MFIKGWEADESLFPSLFTIYRGETGMEFFTYFYEDEIKQYFFQRPRAFTKYTNRELLSYGLGATLYMPATRPNIHQEILSKNT